jgi:hypothetical protein
MPKEFTPFVRLAVAEALLAAAVFSLSAGTGKWIHGVVIKRTSRAVTPCFLEQRCMIEMTLHSPS